MNQSLKNEEMGSEKCQCELLPEHRLINYSQIKEV